MRTVPVLISCDEAILFDVLCPHSGSFLKYMYNDIILYKISFGFYLNIAQNVML